MLTKILFGLEPRIQVEACESSSMMRLFCFLFHWCYRWTVIFIKEGEKHICNNKNEIDALEFIYWSRMQMSWVPPVENCTKAAT
jgi:hypothetical protein